MIINNKFVFYSIMKSKIHHISLSLCYYFLGGGGERGNVLNLALFLFMNITLYFIQCYRDKYEAKINSLRLKVYFSATYTYKDGALHLKDGGLPFIEITIDRRKSIESLIATIQEVSYALFFSCFVYVIFNTLSTQLAFLIFTNFEVCSSQIGWKWLIS